MDISVIVPVHNSEKYLESCMQSILTQEGFDLEIILVENGSTDQSPEMCRSYAEQYPYVKVMDIGPAGVSAARNTGIKAASGKWIVFVDSDDCLQPKALNVLKLAESEEYDVIVSEYSRRYPEEQKQGTITGMDASIFQKGVLQFSKYKEDVCSFIEVDDFSIWTCWGKYYKREFLTENNILFPEGVRTGEDSLFCLEVFSSTRTAGVADVKSYYYRDNEESVIHVRSFDICENDLLLIKYFEAYRKKIMTDSFPEEEYNSFIARIIIEMAYESDKKDWRKFLRNRRIREIIRKAGFKNLIPGKKNSIRYMKMLSVLKIMVLRAGKDNL